LMRFAKVECHWFCQMDHCHHPQWHPWVSAAYLLLWQTTQEHAIIVWPTDSFIGTNQQSGHTCVKPNESICMHYWDACLHTHKLAWLSCGIKVLKIWKLNDQQNAEIGAPPTKQPRVPLVIMQPRVPLVIGDPRD
jgi:hypothetical protein